MAARGYLGAGDLYISRQVAGVFQEYQGPYECRKFEIKPNVTLLEQKSKGRDTYGQVVETVALPDSSDLTIELGEVNRESLAIALLGTVAAITQGAGVLTNEPVTVKLDAWVALSKANFVGAPVVTNVGGATTYVAGVDYIINPQLGWIKALSGGALANNGIVHVDATYDAFTGDQVRGSTQTQLRARFKLDGKNFADDRSVIVTVHEAVIAADSAFDFLADGFTPISMPGKMKTPVGFTEPFTVDLRNA